MNKPLISVIISTYNWPQALARVLAALKQQTVQDFEIIVADDGSSDETRHFIAEQQPQCAQKITHVWHPDEGFRVAKIRNKAIAQSCSDYVVLLDHDCVPRVNFVEQHLRLREQGSFVTANRILLSPQFTEEVLRAHIDLSKKGALYFLKCKLQGKCNRWIPTINLPLGPLRKITSRSMRHSKSIIGAWKKQLFDINGFNEQFVGWGREDSDLVYRLIQSGMKRKLGHFALCVTHLHHPPHDRGLNNDDMLARTIKNSDNHFPGIGQYLS